ncbi:MAG: NADH-quinone oxidoreductase subunit J, partial [Alphaproteobacteria bacterium HGW-Alphaproteobacteria-12]
MIVTAIAFYLFAAIAVAAGFMVIAARNPVHSVLFLILTFFNVAGLFVLMGAEFLAFILLIVYVGAVAVLFLFVVMMLDISIERMRRGFWNNLPLGALVGLLLVGEMAVVLTGKYFSLEALPAHETPAGYSNTKELARILFTDYAYPFELASIILLVA